MSIETSVPAPALIDTDIFSEFMRGRNAQVAAHAAMYESVHSSFTISVVTLMEVTSGWQRRGLQTRIDNLLQHVMGWEILPVNSPIAVLAGRIHGDLVRTGQPVGVADPLIAATALYHQLTLVTGNTDHYRRLHALGYQVLLVNWRSAES